MAGWRMLGVLALSLTTGSLASAQSYAVQETVAVGDCFRYTLAMKLRGEMTVRREGKPVALPLEASASHAFTEKILSRDERRWPQRSARLYEKAVSTVSVDGRANPRSLRDDRRLCVAQRIKSTPLTYCPSGALTREEVELVSEHFDTLLLVGVLPDKEVAIGDGWKLAPDVVQSLCQFEGLVKSELRGRLEKVADGRAQMSVQGEASGIELGAMAKVKVKASLEYDLLKKRLVKVYWQQTDERDQGPASPASKVETTIELTRASVEEPRELSETALAVVPNSDEPSEGMTRLVVDDRKGRFRLEYARDWHLVGQSGEQLVMRLIDRGDFLAQATVTPWKPADAGKHLEPDEFRRAIDETPGWKGEELLQADEVPADGGRYIYRICVRGELDGVPVVQNCYLVAGPNGEQAVVAVVMKPPQVAKLASRDVMLVAGLTLLKK